MKPAWRASFLVVLSAPVVAWAQSSTTPSTSPSPPSSSSAPSTSPSPSSSYSTPSFDSLDTNHDGVLSKDEFKAGVPQQVDLQQQPGGHGHGGGHHGGGFGGPGGGGGGFGGGSQGGGFGGPGGGFGGGGFGGQHPTGGGSGGQYGGHHGGSNARDRTNPDQMFENLDTNHDGVLSPEEYAAMAHGGASNKDASSGNYHSSNPRPSTNGQSQSQNTNGQAQSQNTNGQGQAQN